MTKAQPIWKDFIVLLEGESWGDSVRYYVTCDGERIFSGKAHRRPGDESIRFTINDICAPYLSQDFRPESLSERGVVRNEGAGRHFAVFDSSDHTLLDEVFFYLDFSFDPSYDATKAGPSLPVTGTVDPRQTLVVSTYDDSLVEVRVTTSQGRELAFTHRGAGTPATLYFPVGDFPDARKIEALGRTYEVARRCGRYVLYYVNAFGGWDSLAVDGTALETDNYTRSTYKRSYDNSAPWAKGTVNYRNDYEKSVKLVTGWLSDEQSRRMHHLFGSTNVYLHDLSTHTTRAVTISDKSFVYKTYRSEGRRLVNYTLNATVSQDFTRQ
ncbi:hypothetical protein [Alistipes sp.]|uniref:hypothetical protein n=1 Tax=Alistipes sp. TaxID=1872444 RepID=UPI003AF1B264